MTEEREALFDALRIGYADPPYPGCAHLYKDHPDYAGEVDHELLLADLAAYDGWCLHTSSVALPEVLEIAQSLRGAFPMEYRVMAWVKPFAAFKRNVSVAYAWEPVLVKAARKPVVKPGMTYRDFLSESMTMKKGLTGAKPERVCHWLFEVMGCEPEDELYDLYPGTGAVGAAWQSWRSQMTIAERGARKQLAWMDEMERVDQELFPDAQPRSEVVVEVERDA